MLQVNKLICCLVTFGSVERNFRFCLESHSFVERNNYPDNEFFPAKSSHQKIEDFL